MMNHSDKTDDWIRNVIAANPIRLGKEGNVVTCPVRLTHCDIFEPQKPQRGEVLDPNKPPKYGCTILFPPGVEQQIQSVLRPVLVSQAKAQFPNNVDPVTGEMHGLHYPLRNQAEKLEQQGFTRGCLFTRVSSKFQPRVVDIYANDLTDKAAVYNGVWAICSLNTYTFSDPRKKGVSLGLQMVMVYASDTKLVSAKADPAKAFEGVKIDSNFDPASQFG